MAPEGGEETVRQIAAAGGEALFAGVDVTQADEVDALIARTVATYGRLDYAHNNAGIEGPGEQPCTSTPRTCGSACSRST